MTATYKSELWALSAEELGGFYRRRQLSPLEVTDALLERIQLLNPLINAFITVTGERAREAATLAEQAFLKGKASPHPLLGIPFSLKDTIPTKGIRTTRGSVPLKDAVPDFDPPVAERLAAAGSVLLGKTNTPEWGWKGATSNLIVGPTRNPWKLNRTSGGSSGGAAAAVAVGLGPLAIGTDGGGSIRIPAAFCGVFGIKPSFGRIPQFPGGPLESLSHLGVLSRTVLDAALVLNATAGPDPRDRHSIDQPAADFVASARDGVDGFRIAWSQDLGYAPIEPEVAALTYNAARAFEEMGAVVEDVSPQLPDPYDIFDTIFVTGQAAIHYGEPEDLLKLLDPSRRKFIDRAHGVNGIDLAAAAAARTTWVEQIRRFMEGYDLLLTPCVPLTAFPIDQDGPESVAGRSTPNVQWSPFTYPFNLSGQPAASVPCGFASDGLPIALQIVGRWHDDAAVIRAAAAFEDMRPWSHRWPALEP